MSRQEEFAKFVKALHKAGVTQPRFFSYDYATKFPTIKEWNTGNQSIDARQAWEIMNSSNRNVGYLFAQVGDAYPRNTNIVVIDIDNDAFKDAFFTKLEEIGLDFDKLAYRSFEHYTSYHLWFQMDTTQMTELAGSSKVMWIGNEKSEIFHPFMKRGHQLVTAGSYRAYDAEADAKKGREAFTTDYYCWTGESIPMMPEELWEYIVGLTKNAPTTVKADGKKSAALFSLPDAKKYSRISDMVNQIIKTVGEDKESGRITAGKGVRNQYCTEMRYQFVSFLLKKQHTPSKEEVESRTIELQSKVNEVLDYDVTEAEVRSDVARLIGKVEEQIEQREADKYNHIKLADNLHERVGLYADVNDQGIPTGRFYTLNEETKLWKCYYNIDALIADQIKIDGQYDSPRINSAKTKEAAKDHIRDFYRKEFTGKRARSVLATKSFIIDVNKYARGAYRLSQGNQDGIRLMEEAKKALEADDLQTDTLPYDPDYNATCPKTIEWINRVFPDQQLAVTRMLMFMGGFALPDLRMNKFLAWYGDSQAGKSTLARVLTSVWSEQGYVEHPVNGTHKPSRQASVAFEQVEKNNGIEQLEMACYNLLEEIPQEMFNNNSTLAKTIIECLPMSIRAAYQRQARDYHPKAKWFLIGNAVPMVSRGENSDAINNRIIMLEAAGRSINDRQNNDPHFGFKVFQEEHVGIFHMFMVHLGQYLDNGSRFPALDEAEMDRLQENKMLSNAPLAWMTEYLEYTGKKTDRIDLDVAYQHYKKTLREDSPGRTAEAKGKFSSILNTLRFGEQYGEPACVEKVRVNGGRSLVLTGVKFNSVGDRSMAEVRLLMADHDAALRSIKGTPNAVKPEDDDCLLDDYAPASKVTEDFMRASIPTNRLGQVRQDI